MRLAVTLATLFLLTLPLNAADWISLRSEHFQLFGNASEGTAPVALALELLPDGYGP